MQLSKIITILILLFISKFTYSQTYKVKNSDRIINVKELFAFNNGKTQIILNKNFNIPFNSPNWLYYHKKNQILYRYENGAFIEVDKTKWIEKIKDIKKSIIDAEKIIDDIKL